MVKKILMLLLLAACPVYLVSGQAKEYIVENVDDVPSYYYYERSSPFSNLESSNLLIQVINARGDGIYADVYLLNGSHNEDTIVISTDSTGLAYIPKEMIWKAVIFIPPKGDLYNGIKGGVDDIRSIEKLTIVLGLQALSKMRIKSNFSLSVNDIQQIVDSVRKKDCIPQFYGVTIDFSIEI